MNDATIFIGRIIAPYLIITGLGFFFSGDFYKEMIKNAHKSDYVLINLSGMVHFLIGIAIVTNHFQWSGLLKIIISIAGFAFLLKGIFLIFLPKLMLKTNNTSIKSLHGMSAGFIAVGLVIGYLSYIA